MKILFDEYSIILCKVGNIILLLFSEFKIWFLFVFDILYLRMYLRRRFEI